MAEQEDQIVKVENAVVIDPPLSLDDDGEATEAEQFALKVLRKAASLKSVRIDRGKFIRTEFGKHCPWIDVELAVAETPAAAGATAEHLDKIAVEAIDFEAGKCAGLSFLAGIPGGIAMAATVPGDLAQYFCHVLRIEQKLAYVYGWQSFMDDGDEIDDETLMKLIVFMGVMLQVGGASQAITKFATEVAQEGVKKTIQKQALTKTSWYLPMKAVLGALGVQLTKETFAKTASKVVPVIGGAISGGLTYVSFKPCAERLRKYLRTLPCSGISEDEPDHADANLLEAAGDHLSSAAGEVADLAGEAGKKAQEVGAVAAEQAGEAAQVVGSVLAAGADQAGKALSDGAKVVGSFFGRLGKR